MTTAGRVSLTSQWYLQPGAEDAILAVIRQELVPAVQANEPGTLTYLVHRPLSPHSDLQSLPPTDSRALVFFEEYASADSFRRHVSGPIFTDFVSRHGAAFVQSGGRPYSTVTFLSREAGFVRVPGQDDTPRGQMEVSNRHPAVMFEVMSPQPAEARRFYAEVFGWSFDVGAEGFSYIHFPAGAPPLLGGIGQADAATPGLAPGTNFYLLVDDLEATLQRATGAGGTVLMPPAAVDGYHFAMFTDPEGFAIGLVTAFTS